MAFHYLNSPGIRLSLPILQVQAADVPCFPQLVESIVYSGHWVGILSLLLIVRNVSA